MIQIPNSFPEFNLKSLLTTVFDPRPGQRVAILIDLPDPAAMKDFSFLSMDSHPVQKRAVEYFFKPLNEYVLKELGLTGGEIFAYAETGGSNLDLPDQAVDREGNTLSLSADIYSKYDIILCISSFSATAPLTALAKDYNFRGATLHGLNDIILSSGLCVDYFQVSAEAEKIRAALSRADAIEIEFVVGDEKRTLRLELAQQEAQKSHGLCRSDVPDIANLPAGEVYFVPAGAFGSFPFKFEDGTIAFLNVENRGVVSADLLTGSQSTVNQLLARIEDDPAFGEIGELGFGTQRLPWAGVDIQDEKILGTVHVATGRSDHLGGDITPDQFKHKKNASHEDILFAPHKTPEVLIPRVTLFKNGEQAILLENYAPSAFLERVIGE